LDARGGGGAGRGPEPALRRGALAERRARRDPHRDRLARAGDLDQAAVGHGVPKEGCFVTTVELRLIDMYWRAANYLSVGQIYLLDNPLLREPLKPQHIKPRLLGHWGTTPGLNFVYAH